MSAEKTKRRTANPFLLSIALVCTIGIGIGVELTRVYLKHLDPSFESFCSIGKGIDCEVVAASDYASVFGVPNSLWAIFAYSWLLAIAIWGMARRGRGRGRWPLGMVLLVSTAMLVAAVVLFGIMKFAIGSLCILCLGLDVVNIALFVMAVAAWRRSARDQSPLRLVVDDLKWLAARPVRLVSGAAITVALLGGTVAYANHADELLARARAEAAADGGEGAHLRVGPDHYVPTPGPAGHTCKGADCECGHGSSSSHQPTVQMGRDEQGHQWIGAAEPKLVVQEFTDYECPYCRRAHMRLRALMARNPTYLRVVHRNFPLDQACNASITRPFHKRACMLAKVAYCAGEQGRFWEMNDYLFQHAGDIKKSQLTEQQLASELELDMDRYQCCLEEAEVDAHVKGDVAAGIELGIRGTPSFVINGKVTVGSLPKDVVAEIVGN